MIFVTLGTQDKDFSRLLKRIDNNIKKGYIKDKVIVQAGTTKYKSENMEIFDFISSKEFEKYIDECDLLITHGGVGSILNGITRNKKVIAVPRLKKYDEHENDHQLKIINEFVNYGYILGMNDLKYFESVYNKVPNFKPKRYKSNNEKFVNYIENYISLN